MLEPKLNELPSIFADRLGLDYTNVVTVDHKKSLGQFFTPLEVSNFIASKIKASGPKLKILDPGCGVGILSCSLIEKLIEISPVREIELVAFETDIQLIPFSEKCLDYLRSWLLIKRIDFKFWIVKNDFILANSKILDNQTENENDQFDIIITNPPYFKINKDDIRSIAAKSIINGQTNIYSIFLLISAKLLRYNGQLAFITPRSFASGSYFKLFREKFFSLISLNYLHLFESRKDAFKRDNVLQESIIIWGIKQKEQSPSKLIFPEINDTGLTISISKGLKDLDSSISTKYQTQDILDLNSEQKMLHIPSSVEEYNVIKTFRSWKHSLFELGYDVSTGPVIAYRIKKDIFIENEALSKNIPLIWIHNVSEMQFNWPLEKGDKGQYIKFAKSTISKLLPNKNYVLVKRFSSKDDRKRLVACPYFSNFFPEVKNIGIENHINYIHKFMGILTDVELLGISALLNSTLFDVYFRTFNGNTNVSVTELKNIPFPPSEILINLGHVIKKKGKKKISQKFIDSQLNQLLQNVR